MNCCGTPHQHYQFLPLTCYFCHVPLEEIVCECTRYRGSCYNCEAQVDHIFLGQKLYSIDFELLGYRVDMFFAPAMTANRVYFYKNYQSFFSLPQIPDNFNPHMAAKIIERFLPFV